MAKPQSFCKIFFADLFPNNIRIPSEFAKNHTNLIWQISRLRIESSGRYSWNVKVEQIDNDLYVTDGWSEFVAGNHIRNRDFLLFRLVGKSMFRVSVYRSTGCLKDPFSPNPHHNHFNSDPSNYSQRCRKDVGGPSGIKRFSRIIKEDTRSYLHVPKAFAEETGIARQTQVILQDLRGREWTVEIDSNRRELYNRICLSRGWNHFRKANGLVFGTVCWFEFDPSSGNLVLTNRPNKTSSVDMSSTRATKQATMPSFFKVLFNDDYNHTLRLPLAFSNKYGEALSTNSKLVTGFGETWNVKLEVVDERYCFTRGWDRFVEDFKLGFGEYLVFTCNVAKSEFRVSVYGICACERKFPTKNLPSMDEDNVEYGHISVEGHPYFTHCLKKHQVSRLQIRKGFAEAAGLMNEKAVVLQYPPNERCWPVLMDRVIIARNKHYSMFELRRGWSKFRQENHLEFGETYLFEYIVDKKVIEVKLVRGLIL